MKKATKKTPSKASHKKAVKDLDVKPSLGETVRGGFCAVEHGSAALASGKVQGHDISVTKTLDNS